ncbi:Listeria-Bacteroides repeat domain [Bifidobacterium lemurum]|uniref:Listeria-Bacteroides repeat domain n=1 Tax=Bifidobacterium lemurum TaxID=1603886 RepID=A0A261FSS0_9BIFI|nr:InlB B-repeat-containing protein [Bifidobacterium lemurum]OZG62232.1 Listeria-Bacteroides repeat domain [Bifidobacterium lemurum]QOL33602.1 InlB B-repeat-containing protein [Bifidobacterium lemurum]
MAWVLSVVMLAALAGWAVPAASADEPAASAEVTVDFDADGGSAVESQRVAAGGLVAAPDDPTRDGYVFDGWWTSAGDDGRLWDFDADTASDSMTLTARWLETDFVVNIEDGWVWVWTDNEDAQVICAGDGCSTHEWFDIGEDGIWIAPTNGDERTLVVRRGSGPEHTLVTWTPADYEDWLTAEVSGTSVEFSAESADGEAPVVYRVYDETLGFIRESEETGRFDDLYPDSYVGYAYWPATDIELGVLQVSATCEFETVETSQSDSDDASDGTAADVADVDIPDAGVIAVAVAGAVVALGVLVGAALVARRRRNR